MTIIGGKQCNLEFSNDLCFILLDPPVKNIFQLTTNTLGGGYN